MYSVESIEQAFERMSYHFVAEDVVLPAPNYIMGVNWTDELREKNGYSKQPDGSWGTLVNSKQLFDLAKKDVLDMYASNKKMSQEIETLRKKVYELEYGCRVAAKAITKSQSIKEEIQ